MISEELRPALQTITSRLRQINTMMPLTSGGAPLWFARLLSDVMLLVDGDEIEYVTGAQGDEGVEVIVITTHRIVRATASDIDLENDEARANTVVHPRSEIRSLEVTAEEGVYSQSVYSNWPGKLTVVLILGDSRLTLPLERSFDFDYEPAVLRELLRETLETLDAKQPERS